MMNIKMFFSILCLGFLMVSCGDDEAPEGCAQADFVGTWSGMEDCDLLGTQNDVTITISAAGSDNISVDGGQFLNDEISMDGCSGSTDNTTFGNGFEYRASYSDPTMTLTHIVKTLGATVETCTYTLTKN